MAMSGFIKPEDMPTATLFPDRTLIEGQLIPLKHIPIDAPALAWP